MCFLKVSLACLGSMAAAEQLNVLGNSQITCYKTFGTSCRPRLYMSVVSLPFNTVIYLLIEYKCHPPPLRKRLGTLPKPLKHGLLWTTAQTRRGRIHDVIDDVFRFAYSRYFVNEVVEAVIGDMWCDSTILRVIPPTQEEIDK